MKTEWIDYEPGDSDAYIPVEQWGRDHWTTLLYVETCAVDNDGVLDNRKLRTDARLHREFAVQLPYSSDLPRGDLYPTRLKGGKKHPERHDDWSCLEDMAAQGLLTLRWKKVNDEMFGCNIAQVKLTRKGRAFVADLRAFKANGNHIDDYEVDIELIKNIAEKLR